MFLVLLEFMTYFAGNVLPATNAQTSADDEDPTFKFTREEAQKLVPDLITLADVWLGWDIGRGQGDAATVAVAARAEEEVGEGEAIFGQLLLVAGDASVSRDDYYSAEEGWDLMGLRSDLEIFSSQAK